MTSYMVEYAYIHDDENKNQSQLSETSRELSEGLSLEGDLKHGTMAHVKRRELQARMAVKVMDIDKEKGRETLRLWKEMSEVFVQIRDLEFQSLDHYLRLRVIDAGCPWTMSLLSFAMDFILTEDQTSMTAAIESAAYDAWVLVNDYFSWEKELLNFEMNGKVGEIASSVYLFMKWYAIDAKESKRRLRAEIQAREQKYCRMKRDFLARGDVPKDVETWFELLDKVTAGNFAWSMTTARYDMCAEDAYPGLRAKHRDGFDGPISHNPNNGVIAEELEANKRREASNGRSTAQAPNGQLTPPDSGISLPLACQVESRKAEALFPRRNSLLSAYEEAILEPSKYIESLPSKGIRNSAIDALEICSSLMLDDIQDDSQMRRGFPATHAIFGAPQTINTANLLMVKAIKSAESLSPVAVTILINRLIDGHMGQGMDLRWSHHTLIPDKDEYFAMVDGKTGALFMLLAELMRSEGTINKDLDLSMLMQLTGRFFQVRDDYLNLEGAEYYDQKGFADDIGEGKLSLPLIYALESKHYRDRLLSILQQRKPNKDVPNMVRKVALDSIKDSGGLQRTHDVVMQLQDAVAKERTELEKRTGMDNWILRLVEKRLEVE
ncbi:MAG: hypothetical protein M1828_002164 [Chrysothrix sp. TS-e1954]|nr:MAG: hypothetical protein M1828_002164 [Chrysothrix sp. TS-e1954]